MEGQSTEIAIAVALHPRDGKPLAVNEGLNFFGHSDRTARIGPVILTENGMEGSCLCLATQEDNFYHFPVAVFRQAFCVSVVAADGDIAPMPGRCADDGDIADPPPGGVVAVPGIVPKKNVVPMVRAYDIAVLLAVVAGAVSWYVARFEYGVATVKGGYRLLVKAHEDINAPVQRRGVGAMLTRPE